jgi:nitrate reductase beta subunit
MGLERSGRAQAIQGRPRKGLPDLLILAIRRSPVVFLLTAWDIEAPLPGQTAV